MELPLPWNPSSDAASPACRGLKLLYGMLCLDCWQCGRLLREDSVLGDTKVVGKTMGV